MPLQGGESVLYVEVTLLGPHTSDPPDVPSLQEARETLQQLVDSGDLTVSVCSSRSVLHFRFG